MGRHYHGGVQNESQIASHRISPVMRLLLSDIVRDGPVFTERVEWSTVRALWRRKLIEQRGDGRWCATARGVRLIQETGPAPVTLVWAASRPIVAGDPTGILHLVDVAQLGTTQASLCGTSTTELARWVRAISDVTTEPSTAVCLRCARHRQRITRAGLV